MPRHEMRGLCGSAEIMTLRPGRALNLKEYFRVIQKQKEEKEHRAGDLGGRCPPFCFYL